MAFRGMTGAARLAAVAVVVATGGWLLAAGRPAVAQVPRAPFAAVQLGTNGCIEVGVRPAPPFNQPLPLVVPAGFDVTGGYPAFGYDPTGFTPTSGTNACRYNFRDAEGNTIGSGYCVQFAAGQRSGTGYDPEPFDGTIRNEGFVRRILTGFWPATNLPDVPSTNPTVANRQRSGTVAMAIHFFTDGIVLPPDYQDPALYNAVRQIVTAALAAGPLPAPPDPTPTIDGPDAGFSGDLLGPYTVGANATGDVTVTVDGADAFTDAAGTVPFPSGGTLPAGGQLWIRTTTSTVTQVSIHATGPVVAAIGTLMVGDPAFRVQSMELAGALTLTGKTDHVVTVAPRPPAPRLFSRASADRLQTGDTVADAVAVAGAPAGASTLTVTLFGPVAPAGGGCAGIDWTGAPVAHAYPAVPVTGDGTFDTPDLTLSAPGCYSFGASLDLAGPVATLPPGDPAETPLVVSPPVPPPVTVTTRVSRSAVEPGDTVSDRVTVSGLQPGRTMTIVSVLLGPVAPDADGGCAGVAWQDVRGPVAAVSAARTVHDGTFDSPAVRLTRTGCYSYQQRVTTDDVTGGAETAVDDGLGVPGELILVRLPVTSAGPVAGTVGVAVAAILSGAALLIGAYRPTRARLR